MEAAGVGWSVELGSDRRERIGRRGGRREVAGRMVEEKKLADTPYFVFLRGEDTHSVLFLWKKFRYITSNDK